MLVDTERVLLDLKRRIAEKSHHGQRDLFVLIGELEARHSIEESLPEKAIRLYGWHFFQEAVKSPGSQEARVPPSDGAKARPLGGDSTHESQEDDNGRTGSDHDGEAERPGSVTSITGRSRAFH